MTAVADDMTPSSRDIPHNRITPDTGSRRPRRGHPTSGQVRRFVLHYLEMVAAMLVGMIVLGTISSLVLDLPERTGVEIVEMAVWMTAPMVAWMRIRGHSWRVSGEMAAAMVLPAAGALALLGADLVTDKDTLLMLEHTVMFPAMLVAMLMRRDEYTGHGHHSHPG